MRPPLQISARGYANPTADRNVLRAIDQIASVAAPPASRKGSWVRSSAEFAGLRGIIHMVSAAAEHERVLGQIPCRPCENSLRLMEATTERAGRRFSRVSG